MAPAVADDTRTTTRLLQGLFDPQGREAWLVFDRRYRPIVWGVARRMGLSEADASDVAQEAITEFLSLYREHRYDREKGRLRSWLAGITRRVALNFRRRAAAHAPERGVSAIESEPSPEEVDRLWDQERESELLRQAMEELKKTRTSDRSIEAFELVAIRRVPAATVARQLGITAQDVYVAKARVAERLREILARLHRVYEDDL
ncbi:MAG: RNA polymerase sigma factor [Phycisphaerales bacterium]